VTEWEPATEAEAAMRDALRMSDQELYFRILARTELYLPVSADALAGRTAMGWGTWNSGGRTHVLSFTSPDAMRLCLAENAGSARKIVFPELAATWPNHEWWLAVNPGLPIEGYLPPWFVTQLARGDVRMPGRSGSRRAAPPTPEAPVQPPPTAAPMAAPVSAPTSAPMSASGRVSMSVPSDPLEPDDVLDPDEAPEPVREPGRPDAVGARRSAHAAGVRSNGRDPVRRLRRYEASIIDATVIDAEIIESTVIGATAMEARFVNATIVNSRRSEAQPGQPDILADADIIDATVLDISEPAPPAPSRSESSRSEPTRAESTRAESTRAEPPKATAAAGARRRATADKGQAEPAAIGPAASFTPANEVEATLLAAATSGQTDNFLSTLLLAKVLVPIPTGESPEVRPDDPAFPWRREVVDGQPYVVVFTSPDRMNEFMDDDVVAITAKFVQVIRVWPDVKWAFAVNPGTPVGATLPGIQIKALAAWAADVGLTADDEDYYDEVPAGPVVQSTSTIIMQKPVAPSQVDYYLERGYDRASGFVHRAAEILHLRTPDQLYSSLGLSYTGSPFERDATEIYVLRWAAHRGDLYRIPYGGQNEAAMRAMQGWMIERAPFRGNGFAPVEDGQVIAEFKVDSIRLPHGAQMWRLNSAGDHVLVAVLDADECAWRPAIDLSNTPEWDPSAPKTASITAAGEPAVAVPVARPANRTPAADPTDDPLDPRWRPTARVGSDWTASRVGER
jgi:SseB protein N-terminal domain